MQISHKCKPKMIIYKGATYNFPINLKIGKDKKVIHKDDVKQVDFFFEDLVKTYPDKGVTHNEENFVLSLSTKDTTSMTPTSSSPLEIRVVFNDGNVKIDKETSYTVIDTRSAKEVAKDE